MSTLTFMQKQRLVRLCASHCVVLWRSKDRNGSEIPGFVWGELDYYKRGSWTCIINRYYLNLAWFQNVLKYPLYLGSWLPCVMSRQLPSLLIQLDGRAGHNLCLGCSYIQTVFSVNLSLLKFPNVSGSEERLLRRNRFECRAELLLQAELLAFWLLGFRARRDSVGPPHTKWTVVERKAAFRTLLEPRLHPSSKQDTSGPQA